MTFGVIVGSIAVVLAVVIVGVFIDRRRPLLPRPEVLAPPPKPAPTHGLGEAPQSAFRVGDAQLARLRSSQRCLACRSEMTYLADADDRVRYDGRELVVLHFACPRDQTKRTIYVEPAPKT